MKITEAIKLATALQKERVPYIMIIGSSNDKPNQEGMASVAGTPSRLTALIVGVLEQDPTCVEIFTKALLYYHMTHKTIGQET